LYLSSVGINREHKKKINLKVLFYLAKKIRSTAGKTAQIKMMQITDPSKNYGKLSIMRIGKNWKTKTKQETK